MAFYFPEGSALYFSSTFGSALNITALTNANPARATSTGHGLADNDPVLLTSGWEDATNNVFEVDQFDANTFDILGLNSTNTTFFPAGTGVGNAKKVTGWTQMPQVIDFNSQGGDARLTNVELLAARNSIAVPTGFNPSSMTITMAHDPGNANYQAMVNLSRTLTPVAFKFAIGGGGRSYGYGYMSVSEMPQLQRNQVNRVSAQITLLNRLISY